MRMRLSAQPGEEIDRSRSFTFTWNGGAVPAYGGDTIASALAATGVRVFSRSFKYHRPRGLLTASYLDPGCFLQVGDEPNVRAAHRLAAPGLDVRAQNTWPSLNFDVKAANGLAGRFLSAGFYYKTFIWPRRLWPAYESVLQRFIHAGEISPDTPRVTVDKRYAHPDVLVAGGGPAGMAAAVAAAQAGAEVMLVEEEHRLGGHLRWGDGADLAALRELRELVAATPGIEVLTNSVVTGRYDDNWVAVVRRGLPDEAEQLIKARAKVLVVAPGLIERPYVFAGNDVPGVMLSTAVRRLVNLYSVKPGERAVVLSANAAGDAAASDLRRVGIEVARVVDARSGGDIAAVRGRGGVKGVELADGTSVDCDLVVTATGWTAPTSLLNMAGDRPVYNQAASRFFPAALPDTVLAAGGIAGDGSRDQLIEHAQATGREAARRAAGIRRDWRAARPGAGRASQDGGPLADDSPVTIPALPVDPHPGLFRGRTHGIVDFCEDVSSKDIVAAVNEGYDAVELAKRYTTATMGPTQGKLEVINTVAITAAATGKTIAETGTTTWRPPYAPITLGALAGRELEPVRYSPMQAWHESHDARSLIAGAWIRPDHYGDPQAEARNVRERVGIIDVTPIGKLDLRGPDVPKLLNLLYVNKWSKLAIGKVRYGVMCADDGVVFDDGVTGRLGPEHYLMSTTSSGAAAVWEWAESWLQTSYPDWRVHITPVTTAYASMNIAGPNSRELLARVTSGVDLANEAFPYMEVRTGRVAGRRRLRALADRVHRRAQLRGTRSRGLRPVRLGGPVGSRPGPGRGPLRGGSPARPAPGEGPPDRRAGHRRADPRLQRRAGLGDQARQGRLRRQAGTRVAERRGGRHAPRRPAARRRRRGAARGQPDRRGHGRRRFGHRRPDHVQPDVPDARPRGLPRPGGGPAGQPRHPGHRPAARRQAAERPGNRAHCPRGPGRGEDACLRT